MQTGNSIPGKVLIVGPIPGRGNYIGGIGTMISRMLRAWDLVYPVAFCNTDTGRRDYGSTGRLNLRNLLRLLRNAVGILRAVRREKPALVHFHTSRHWALVKDMLLAGMVKLVSRSKSVAHIHSASYPGLLIGRSRRGRGLQFKLLMAMFDRVVLMSESIKAEIASELEPGARSRFESAARVIYNFVELARLGANQGNQEGPVTFLFLGNVGPGKGIFDLIAAAASLKHEIDFRLIVAGPFDSPTIGAEVRRRVEKADLSRYLELTGPVDGEQKESFLQAADVFVLPSYAEGVPIAMLEAMSYGLPVVATPVGGIPEVLPDGEAGFLVRTGDISGLCAALERLGSSREMRQRMGQCGRGCVERNHTPGRFLRELESLYRELLVSGETDRKNVSSYYYHRPNGPAGPSPGLRR